MYFAIRYPVNTFVKMTMSVCFGLSDLLLLARLDQVQEELLYYPRPRRRRWVGIGVGGGVGVSKKFIGKVFYVMGKALSGELSCPCDRFCFILCLISLDL